jgi:hypothetical protein
VIPKHGPCWEAVCRNCDHVNETVWQKKRPALRQAPVCAWCESKTRWLFTYVQEVGFLGRMSGYSSSESDFVPHFNTATGQFVRTLAQMKDLQLRHGLEDVVVKGRGERFIPRDWLHARADRAREAERAGVRVTYEERE